MQPAAPPLVRFVRFLGRVKFTMFLLLAGVVIMAAGTLVESRHGRQAAWDRVYGTAWFDLFLLLIAVNLVVSVIVRMPIQRHQWGFVLTHLAIVVLLGGAWISRTFGYEGRLMVFEGQEENRLRLENLSLDLTWTGDQRASFRVDPTTRQAGRTLQEASPERPSLRILELVPDGDAHESLAEARAGEPPGLTVTMTGSGLNARDWMLADHPRHGRIRMGPWSMSFATGDLGPGVPVLQPMQLMLLASADGRIRLARTTDAGPEVVDVTVGTPIPLGAHGTSMTVERLLPHARADVHVEALPPGKGTPFVRVQAALGGTAEQAWLALGDMASWTLDGQPVTVTFGYESRTLPFSVALRDFEMELHPGSSRPRQYASHVTVTSPSFPEGSREVTISMNRPLDVDGFRLFQSSYQLGRSGGPDATILTVSRDPGAPLVYLAFVLVVIGIAWYVKRRMPDRGPLVGVPGAPVQPSLPDATPVSADRFTRTAVAGGLAAIGILLAGATAGRAGELAAPGSLPIERTRGWAIMADGRSKPLQTFADETVAAITGRESLSGWSSLELVWGMVLAPEAARERALVRVDSKEIKAALGLASEEKRFSFADLTSSSELFGIVERANRKEDAEEPLSRLERDAQEIESRLMRMHALLQGTGLTIVPVAQDGGSWATPVGMVPTSPGEFAVAEAFVGLREAYAAGDAAGFAKAADLLSDALPRAGTAPRPSAAELQRELFHEDLNAFGKAWKLYLLGFLTLLFLGFSERRWGYWLGVGLLAAGFALHATGIGLRWAIAQRAPVSNMYESLAFMGAGAIAIGLVPELIWRRRFFGIAAGLTGFLSLLFAEHLPIDSAINPLVPVLAHTYWLSVHVMTIMLSYSALAVAMALGHGVLFVELFQPARTERLHALSQALYKTLQVGLLFLAAGIACGAVWANESWGRYWGWDPKETWSLITFFVYLVIVHARFAGWLREFGLAASAIIGFMSVVMTYYGVNFVLASGLHSYGFADGGQYYAALYVVIEVLVIAGAWMKKRSSVPLPRPAEGAQG